jgi:hypothetical protein
MDALLALFSGVAIFKTVAEDVEEAQLIASDALAASPQQPGISSESRLKEKP